MEDGDSVFNAILEMLPADKRWRAVELLSQLRPTGATPSLLEVGLTQLRASLLQYKSQVSQLRQKNSRLKERLREYDGYDVEAMTERIDRQARIIQSMQNQYDDCSRSDRQGWRKYIEEENKNKALAAELKRAKEMANERVKEAINQNAEYHQSLQVELDEARRSLAEYEELLGKQLLHCQDPGLPAEPVRTPEDYYLALDARRCLDQALSHLTPRERLVLERRYFHEWSLAGVGVELEVGGVRVRQLECKALRKLRHPSANRWIKQHEHTEIPESFRTSLSEPDKEDKQTRKKRRRNLGQLARSFIEREIKASRKPTRDSFISQCHKQIAPGHFTRCKREVFDAMGLSHEERKRFARV